MKEAIKCFQFRVISINNKDYKGLKIKNTLLEGNKIVTGGRGRRGLGVERGGGEWRLDQAGERSPEGQESE